MDPIVKAGREKLTASEIALWLEAHPNDLLVVGDTWYGRVASVIRFERGRANIMEKDGQKTGPTNLSRTDVRL